MVQLQFETELSNYDPSQADSRNLPHKKPLGVGEGLVSALPFTDFEVEHILNSYITELEHIQFDLIHLGLGTDGHMASLFPASDFETTQSVQLTFPTAGLEPQVQRLSLSLHTINAALVKQFFVTGRSKKAILEQIRNGADYPAARVQNAEWWLDQAASLGE